jgi:Chromo (CHRromatin Organisation MOdifier) domain
MGRSPRVIPPLVLTEQINDDVELHARTVIERIELDVNEAKDKLLMSKVQQAFHANEKRGLDPCFAVGDRVMLSTLHRRREFKAGHPNRVAKFFPRYDGPYDIIDKHEKFSTYTLDLPNSPNIFPTFHVSVLKRFTPNDPSLFPSREHTRPGLVVTSEGVVEFAVDRIMDECRHGRGMQYLVRWVGYGPEEDRWLPRRNLEDCQALDGLAGLEGAR